MLPSHWEGGMFDLASTEIMEIVFGELRQKIREQRALGGSYVYPPRSPLPSPGKSCIIPLRRLAACSPLPFISLPGNRRLARRYLCVPLSEYKYSLVRETGR